MTRRTLLAAAAVASRATASSDLLARVAERYRDTSAYSVVAVVSGSAGGVETWSTSHPVRQHFITVNGLTRADYEAGDEWTWVRGAQESTVYRGDNNEYRLGPNNSEVGSDVQRFLADMHTRLGKRFALLRNIPAAEVEVLKDEQLKTGGAKRLCSVLLLKPRKEAWREKLWVDPQTAYVWKSSFDYPQEARRLGGTRIVAWEQIDFAPTVTPGTFTFTPPRKARRVERFSVRPQADLPMLQSPND